MKWSRSDSMGHLEIRTVVLMGTLNTVPSLCAVTIYIYGIHLYKPIVHATAGNTIRAMQLKTCQAVSDWGGEWESVWRCVRVCLNLSVINRSLKKNLCNLLMNVYVNVSSASKHQVRMRISNKSKLAFRVWLTIKFD